MTDGDDCLIKPGMWGLYIHHECQAHKYDLRPEYVEGTFENRERQP